ncbi:HAD family hydrolase [Campylobacter devanensis]|uniref:HAD family hydrolase n=1 Tax=Campylobacter devanensis TaxID=3161138 RepID=UPI000A351071|nr:MULTISPECIES: HAD-IA family hydrolase [unclassified Campylobacter]
MIKNILWDFDGVIIDSMAIREYGFREIFKNFDKQSVDKLIQYHNNNGGLSRFHKIEYFFSNILKQNITQNEILQYADKFTTIMRQELINPKHLIIETVKFIKNNYKNYNFHIVSGSENNELNYLCKKLNLSQYFISIHGSPTPKNDLVSTIITDYNYSLNETILIGDSINDYEAAIANKIEFYGYNNKDLKNKAKIYIDNFNIVI